MPDDKNFFAALFDFSFQQQLTRRLVKLLYIIGILAGGIYVVARVVIGFQQSTGDGLFELIAGIVGLFVGILIWRTLLEITLVILRISDGIERATHSSN